MAETKNVRLAQILLLVGPLLLVLAGFSFWQAHQTEKEILILKDEATELTRAQFEGAAEAFNDPTMITSRVRSGEFQRIQEESEDRHRRIVELSEEAKPLRADRRAARIRGSISGGFGLLCLIAVFVINLFFSPKEDLTDYEPWKNSC